MTLIIGKKDDLRLNMIAASIPECLVIYNYCKIKNYAKSNIIFNIIIPYEKILQNGFIQNTEISLDELLLQLKILKIEYGNIYNSQIMKNIMNTYHVKVTYNPYYIN